MNDKELFVSQIRLMLDYGKVLEQLYKDLKVDIYDSSIDITVNSLFDAYLKLVFTEAGIDVITWWMYEDVPKKIYSAESDDVIADLTTIESLWDYLCSDKEIYFK